MSQPMNTKPTIVLIHGAFADSSSWNGIISTLLAQNYPVVAASNPLRGLKNDAAELASLLTSIEGPVVLVGHSYGGMLISNAAHGNGQIQALVFVAAFVPDEGETAAQLASRFPGSTLGETLTPVALADGGTDLYIQQERFHAQFAADLPESQARLMAASQRPVTELALNEQSDVPTWKTVPSWFIWGDGDQNIPPAALRWMSERAGGRELVEVAGASHALAVSRAELVADLILRAAQAV
ncbi:MAG: alpha/beta hydrolase [Anaerolineae bacterium]|nr:alpha/beta hydrolase [Anaerolineae bacterium]